MLLWISLKGRMIICAVLIICSGRVEASLLSDWLRGSEETTAEQQTIAKTPGCTLSVDDAYARIIELLSDGRQGEAEDLASAAVKTHRDDIRILFAKAVLERSRWDKPSADAWFAMARKATGSECLSRAAWLSIQLDQHESVEKNMVELIRLSDENPDEIFLLWLTAIQCREQSRVAGAPQTEKWAFAETGKQRYELLLGKFRLGPVMVHHTYANILSEALRVRDQETALEHRLIAVSLVAKGWTLQGLGNTLLKMKKYDWANAVWARAVRLDPLNATYQAGWGNALLELSRYSEAEEKYREAIRLRPMKGINWYDLALCLQKQGGDQGKIFELFQRAVELGESSALGDLGRCYEFGRGVERDWAKAFELYWGYADKFPYSALGAARLGFCYWHGRGIEKDLHKAIEYYEKAIRIDPSHQTAMLSLVIIYTRGDDASVHDYTLAVEIAKQSVSVNEDYVSLRVLANAYSYNMQYDDAIRVIDRAISVFKEDFPKKQIHSSLVICRRQYERKRDELKEKK